MRLPPRRRSTVCLAILGLTLIFISIYTLSIGRTLSIVEFDGSSSTQLRGPSPIKEEYPIGLMEFKMHPDVYHSGADANRHFGNDVWRPQGLVPSYPLGAVHRAPAMHPSNAKSSGEYLQQKLVADFADGSDRLFLMLKTGATTFWKRMPVHVYTTLTRVPHFALYSDAADSLAGYEVIDILQHTSKAKKEHKDFKLYRRLQELRFLHHQEDVGSLKLDGGWKLDKYKNIPMLQHAWDTDPTRDWYIFMDDDTYVFFDTMLDWLKQLNHTEPLYMGSPTMTQGLVFAHGGTGVVLSHGAMKAVFEDGVVGEGFNSFQEEYEDLTSKVCCGDYMVGKLLWDKAKIKLTTSPQTTYPFVGSKFQGAPISTMKFTPKNWCHIVATFHHLTNRDIELLWQYERSKGPHLRKEITYKDLYHDFIKPYITEEIREDWSIDPNDNTKLSEDSSLKKEKEKWIKKHTTADKFEPAPGTPHSSAEACKKWCESKDWCYMFEFVGTPGKDTAMCKIKKQLCLGKPHVDSKKKRVSGWNIDHIRKGIRKDADCEQTDELALSLAMNVEPDEGWWVRHYQDEQIGKIGFDDENH